jgi:hypothetical protein
MPGYEIEPSPATWMIAPIGCPLAALVWTP